MCSYSFSTFPLSALLYWGYNSGGSLLVWYHKLIKLSMKSGCPLLYNHDTPNEDENKQLIMQSGVAKLKAKHGLKRFNKMERKIIQELN